MNKKIFSGIVASALLGGIVLARPVMANEGVTLLRGAGTSGSCYMSSVFIDGMYKILGTCRDLKIALSPEQNRYVVWATGETGKVRRLGEIVNGKLSTGVDTKFVDMFVTAETDGYGNKPSANVLLTGIVQAINFETGEVQPGATVTIAPTPTPTKVTKATATPTEAVSDDTQETTTQNKGVGGALSTVLKIALFGFGALLLIVGVFSFISRKRSL